MPTSSTNGSLRSSATRVGTVTNQAVIKAEPEDGNAAQSVRSEDEDIDSADGNSADEDGYTARKRLSYPAVFNRSLAELHQWLNSSDIELSPPYQRDVVWDDKRKTALINSLFDNYYVPPVIFSVHSLQARSGERLKRVCVDGKQRLTSIMAFMDGEIPHVDGAGQKWYFTNTFTRNGKPVGGRRVLPLAQRHIFSNRTVVCYEFVRLTQDEEMDMFQRVQRGMILTKAEIFRASSGAWQDLAKEFYKDYSDIIELSTDRRSAGWQNILRSFCQIMECENPSGLRGTPKLRINHTSIKEMLDHPELCTDDMKFHLREVFDTFKTLVNTDREVFTFKHSRMKNFAPIEVVGVACLIALYPGRNHNLLLLDIKKMREELRRVNNDLLGNSKVWRDVWDIIDQIEVIHGSTNGTTRRRVERRSMSTQSPRVSQGRLAPNPDSDYEDDYTPAPIARSSQWSRPPIGLSINTSTSSLSTNPSVVSATQQPSSFTTIQQSRKNRAPPTPDWGQPPLSARSVLSRRQSMDDLAGEVAGVADMGIESASATSRRRRGRLELDGASGTGPPSANKRSKK